MPIGQPILQYGAREQFGDDLLVQDVAKIPQLEYESAESAFQARRSDRESRRVEQVFPIGNLGWVQSRWRA